MCPNALGKVVMWDGRGANTRAYRLCSVGYPFARGYSVTHQAALHRRCSPRETHGLIFFPTPRTSLPLAFHLQITDLGLLALTRGASLLQTVVMNGCTCIADAGVAGLAKHCPYLVRLSLKGCVSITDTAIKVGHPCAVCVVCGGGGAYRGP